MATALAAVGALVTSGGLVMLGAAVTTEAASASDAEKVSYCHWDNGNEYGNHSNGSIPGLINGHMDHENDIWPAFEYQGTAYVAQGDQAILANGCVVPDGDTEPDGKVSYCHWDNGNEYGNHSNGSIPGLINGHMGHENDIWPAFEYQGTAYAAQGDQAILANGCVVPEVPDVCSNLEGAQATIPAGYHRGEGNTCVPDLTDLCTNLEGVQTTVPAGYVRNNDGTCTIPPPPPPDLCTNLDGVQTTVPAGYVRNNDGTCSVPPPPPTDVCMNLDGVQATVPSGYELVDGLCVQIAGVEEVAPEITFTDPDCDNLDGADWSGSLKEIVAYEVTGTPGLGESITVAAGIKPALADQYAFPEGFDATVDHTYPTLAELECVLGEETVVPSPKPEKNPPVVLGTEAAVPTQVNAGMASLPGAGTSTNELLAQLLVGAGLILLVAGGWVGFAGRDYGKHHI